jgi:hypothetical protein
MVTLMVRFSPLMPEFGKRPEKRCFCRHAETTP